MGWEQTEVGDEEYYVHDDGRKLEVYAVNGGQWAVDLHHRYGCTRVALEDEKQAAIEDVPTDIISQEVLSDG